MNSALVPFEEYLEDLKDQTGIKNIEPYLEKLRRFVFKAEREIGYSGAIVLKSIVYVVDNINFDGNRIWMPKDWIEFSTIYDESGEVHPYQYVIAGDYLHFADKKTRQIIKLYYYSILFDGFGNPCITRNHQQAVVDYSKWRIKSPMAFMSNNRSDRALEKDYEQDWKDSRDAARGHDVWPNNQQEWNMLSAIGSMSSMQIMILNLCSGSSNILALEAQSKCSLREIEKEMKIYHWQYDNRLSGIEQAPEIDLNWLAEFTEEKTVLELKTGITIPYNKIGRIGFAVQGGNGDDFQIFDILNSRVDSIVFEKYRNETLKIDVYISKEYYSHSNIFFKFIKS